MPVSRHCEGPCTVRYRGPKQPHNLLYMLGLLRPHTKSAEILSFISSHDMKGFVTYFVPRKDGIKVNFAEL